MAINKQDLEDYKEIKELELEDEQGMGDAFDLFKHAVKVHTAEHDLNEDATLSNLDQEFSKYSKYAMEQLEIANIMRSYLKTDRNVIKLNNEYGDNWMDEIIYKNPERKINTEIRKILINRLRNMLILSRSIKGAPLKAFLTYGRDTTNKELGLEKKRGLWDRLMDNKSKEEEELI